MGMLYQGKKMHPMYIKSPKKSFLTYEVKKKYTHIYKTNQASGRSAQ